MKVGVPGKSGAHVLSVVEGGSGTGTGSADLWEETLALALVILQRRKFVMLEYVSYGVSGMNGVSVLSVVEKV